MGGKISYMGEFLGVNVWWFIAIVPFVVATVIIRIYVEKVIINNAVIMTAYGLSGEKISKAIIREAELNDVDIQQSMGSFTDEYTIRSKTIRLSPLAFSPNSVTAAAIAATVTGQAILHKEKNPMLWIRRMVLPVSKLAARLLLPFIVFGLVLSYPPFVKIGIAFYVITSFLQFLTVFIEFIAAKKGVSVLAETGFVTDEELPDIKNASKAAALINEASAATSLTYLFRFAVNIGSGRSTRG